MVLYMVITYHMLYTYLNIQHNTYDIYKKKKSVILGQFFSV